MASAKLNNFGVLQGAELIQIIGEGSNHHFNINSLHCSNQHSSSSKNSFDDSMRPLSRGSQFANQPIFLLIKFSQRCAGSPSHHCKVIPFGRYTEISSIPDDDVAFLREINLPIVDFSRSSLNFANKTVIDIAFLMELIAKIAFLTLLSPGSVLAVSSLGDSIFGLFGFSGISFDECSILDRSTFDLQTHSIQLSLKLSPDHFIFSCFCHAFSEWPYGPGIREWIG